MSEYSHIHSLGKPSRGPSNKGNGGFCNGEGLVDYGKRKRVGKGHRRGGAGRRGQRGSRSASDRRTGTPGGAVRRAGETRETRSARRSRRKSGRAVGSAYIRAAERSGE